MLSGLGEVEGGGFGGAEVDGDRLAVVGVDGQAGGRQDHRDANGAAEGVVDGARYNYAVDVEFHAGAALLALDDVLDQAAGDVGVVVGGVHRGRTSAVSEAGDVGAEWGVLAGFLADGGDVDLRAGDLEAPVAHGAHHHGGGVGDAGEAGAKAAGQGGGRFGRATDGGADGHDAGASDIRFHEVRASCNGVGCGGAGRIGKRYGVVDLEAEIGADGDVRARGGEGGSSQRGNRCTSWGVIESTGGARKDGGHG